MADWRKIHMSISVSRRFNMLLSSHKHGELAQLLYALGIAHLDDYGRLPGDVRVYKLTVYPASERKISDIEIALNLLEKHNLIIWDKQQGVIQYEASEIYQPIGHRRKNSKYPEIERNGKESESPDLFKVEETGKPTKRPVKVAENIPFDIKVEFDKIWKQYPLKDGMKLALQYFTSTVKTQKDLQDIQAALDNYKKHLSQNIWKNVMSGKTWFNNWRDWIPEIKEKKIKIVTIDVQCPDCGEWFQMKGDIKDQDSKKFPCDKCKKKKETKK